MKRTKEILIVLMLIMGIGITLLPNTVSANDDDDWGYIFEAPEVKVDSIWVVSPKDGEYKTGTTIEVVVKLNAKALGTAPKLRIKFGEGNIKTLENGTVKNEQKEFENVTANYYVTYSYTIQNEDKGEFIIFSLDEGNLTNEDGKKAIITTPETKGYKIKANVDTQSNDTPKNQPVETETPANCNFYRGPDKMYYLDGLKKPEIGYRWYITATNEQPQYDKSVFKEGSYNSDKNLLRFDNSDMDKIFELNQDLYLWVYSVGSGTTPGKFVVSGQKIQRPYKYYKDYRMLYGSPLVNNTSSSIPIDGENVALSTSTPRTMNVKIGKVSDTTLLNALKNGEANAWNQLYEYAKKEPAIGTGKISGKYTNYSTQEKLVDYSKIIDNEYYFMYVELDTENGKYYPVEGVSIGRANKYSNNVYYLWFYGSDGFKWGSIASEIKPVSTEPTQPQPISTGETQNKNTQTPNTQTITVKGDTTTSNKILPNTGADVVILVAILLSAVLVVVRYLKCRGCRDIK